MSVITVALFTDFGPQSFYVAQMENVVRRLAPMANLLTLMSDAPRCDPLRSGYLLAALCEELPAGAITIGVVDPGVGTDQRQAVVMEADGRVFVGPGNALFSRIYYYALKASMSQIVWKPERLSPSFHGRDLFAPIAARIATGTMAPGFLQPAPAPLLPPVPDDLWEVIYVDYYGNAVTGIRAESVRSEQSLSIQGANLHSAKTFAAVPPAMPFWYANSMGLIEIAANGADVTKRLNLKIGSDVSFA